MARNGSGARSRAMKGADASLRTRRAFYLRKVVGDGIDEFGLVIEHLDCGHSQRPVSDMIGRTYAERRRCHQCPKPACPDCETRGYSIYFKEGNVIPYRGDDCERCGGSGYLP